MNNRSFKVRKNRKKMVQFASFFTFIMFSVLCEAPLKSMAGDVVLNPGYISGMVSIQGVSLESAEITAYGGEDNASTTINSSSNGIYNLTVNTPEDGSSKSYDVSVRSARSGTDGSSYDYMFFQSQSVDVTETQTSTLNFHVIPGFIEGTLSVTGANMSYAQIHAYLTDGVHYTYAYTYIYSGANGYFKFPVQPNENIRIYGNVWMDNGARYTLSDEYINVSPGATATHNYNLVISGTGSVEGIIGLHGVSGIDRSRVYGYGPNSSYQNVYTNESSYSLPALIPGDWLLYAQSWMNNYDDYFTYPYSVYGSDNLNAPVSIPPGGTVTQDIVSDAAFVNGTIFLSGSKGIQDLQSGYIMASGIYNTPSYGGSSRDNIDPTDGSFNLIITEGDWDIYHSYYHFYNGDSNDYFNSRIYMYDYTRYSNYGGTPVSVSGGQTVSGHNLSYQTGTVTINFSVEGGGELSGPYVEGYGYIREGNINKQYTSSSSSGLYGPSNQGSVTVIGMPMLHNFRAYAYVNGSRTTFGEFDIEVLPGTDIVVDVGGPELTLISPSAESCTSDSSITVSGKVTDDTEVSEVTVNNIPVELISTENQDDPNEVSFSTAVLLSQGPNTIKIVATDGSGKVGSITITVYKDKGAPILDLAVPAEGTTTPDATITVSGTATDDNLIKEITVNGNSVIPVSTNNASDSNEVTFSKTLDLNDGENSIVVEISDTCNTTTVVRTVTRANNAPPVALCNNVAVSAGAGCAAGADINNGSYDPDGDSITTTQSPEGPYPLGINTVTLTVTDENGASDTCIATVTVEDNEAPAISCPPDVTVECDSIPDAATPSATDTCDSSPAVSYDGEVRTDGDCPNRYTLTRTWTATDNAGNRDTCVQKITVQDTKAPSVSSAYATPHVLWPANHKMVEITPVIEVTDSCSSNGNVTIEVKTITSSESDNGYGVGDGNTTSDIRVDGDGRIYLRAERQGTGEGRVYTVTMSIRDECGNEALASFPVEVPHDQSLHSCDDPDCDLNK